DLTDGFAIATTDNQKIRSSFLDRRTEELINQEQNINLCNQRNLLFKKNTEDTDNQKKRQNDIKQKETPL
ncbi:MAG: hypothetical protein KBT09_07760, partial [Bacteroidales bacterium]|nr:hypothetical protein [Candidatus Sodaliphilus fimicaballi]